MPIEHLLIVHFGERHNVRENWIFFIFFNCRSNVLFYLYPGFAQWSKDILSVLATILFFVHFSKYLKFFLKFFSVSAIFSIPNDNRIVESPKRKWLEIESQKLSWNQNFPLDKLWCSLRLVVSRNKTICTRVINHVSVCCKWPKHVSEHLTFFMQKYCCLINLIY